MRLTTALLIALAGSAAHAEQWRYGDNLKIKYGPEKGWIDGLTYSDESRRECMRQLHSLPHDMPPNQRLHVRCLVRLPATS